MSEPYECEDYCELLTYCGRPIDNRRDFYTLTVNLLYEIAHGIGLLIAAGTGTPVESEEIIPVQNELSGDLITGVAQVLLDPTGGLKALTIYNNLSFDVYISWDDGINFFRLMAGYNAFKDLGEKNLKITGPILIKWATDPGPTPGGMIVIEGFK